MRQTSTAKENGDRLSYYRTIIGRDGSRSYVPSLQERSKWTQPQRNIQVNDLVLVADDNVPRYKWPLGKVTEVYVGPDGLVRSVQVRCKDSSLKRPITKICLLEATEESGL